MVCPSIGSFSLEHGRWRIVNGSHYEYRTKIIFTCDPGYYRLGPAHIQCTANGAWSWRNERPHCQSKCVVQLQSTICLALLVEGLNLPDCLCLSYPLPSLSVISCGDLATPPSGKKIGTQTSFGATAIFTCDNGYMLVGSTVRECLSSGLWSGTETRCLGNVLYIHCCSHLLFQACLPGSGSTWFLNLVKCDRIVINLDSSSTIIHKFVYTYSFFIVTIFRIL